MHPAPSPPALFLPLLLFLFLPLIAASALPATSADRQPQPPDVFQEELTLHETALSPAASPLSSRQPHHTVHRRLFASFVFRSTHTFERRPEAAAGREDVYTAFPRVLGQIVKTLNVRAVSLGLTRGRWRYSEWGLPRSRAQALVASFAPDGVDIQASLFTNPLLSSPDAALDVETRWRRLLHALAGHFCASLSSIDATRTFDTVFNETLPTTSAHQPSFVTRRGFLPHESVCTENLTPWTKLLPCRAQAGLASYLKSTLLFHSFYTLMALDAVTVCKNPECTQRRLSLSQALVVVTDPLVNGLFSEGVHGLTEANSACPAAATSAVKLSAATAPVESLLSQNHFHKGLRSVAVVDNASWDAALPPVQTQRYLTGPIQGNGRLQTEISNTGSTAVDVIFQDVVPWYLQLYFHGLQIESSHPRDFVVLRKEFSPGQLRAKPASLRLALRLPAGSKATISIPFERAFLHFTEHPPDANRGFDIGPAMVTYFEPTAGNGSLGFPRTIYTESLLVSLPTPDFSMPYNVLCLTCTVLALAFGSLYNLTTRRFQFKKIEAKGGLLSFVGAKRAQQQSSSS